jgi:hypothetical protein
MSRNRIATLAVVLVAVLGAGVTPPASAAPVLEGTVLAGRPWGPRCVSDCAAFVQAGCPDALARPDGVVASVVNVSSLRGQTLTFAWSSLSNRVTDEVRRVDRWKLGYLSFSFQNSCTSPSWFDFQLDDDPAHRSYSFTVPSHSTWLFVEASLVPGPASWTAA